MLNEPSVLLVVKYSLKLIFTDLMSNSFIKQQQLILPLPVKQQCRLNRRHYLLTRN